MFLVAFLMKSIGNKGKVKFNFLMIAVLVSDLLLASAEFLSGGPGLESRLSLDISLFLFPVILANNSFLSKRALTFISILVVILEFLLFLRIQYFPSLGENVLTAHFCVNVAVGVILLLNLLYIFWLVFLFVSIKRGIRKRSSWSVSGMFVDLVHFLCLMAVAMVLMVTCNVLGSYQGIHVVASDLVMCVLLATSLLKLISKEALVPVAGFRGIVGKIMTDCSEEILEQKNNASSDDSNWDLYVRVVDYFENEQPYLNPYLSLQNIASELFTNKVYVSKAITMYSGRNFCQFVNYYRVRYSMSVARNNPMVSVRELAARSGFNNVTTFTTAFQSYVKAHPKDWIRKCLTKQ